MAATGTGQWHSHAQSGARQGEMEICLVGLVGGGRRGSPRATALPVADALLPHLALSASQRLLYPGSQLLARHQQAHRNASLLLLIHPILCLLPRPPFATGRRHHHHLVGLVGGGRWGSPSCSSPRSRVLLRRRLRRRPSPAARPVAPPPTTVASPIAAITVATQPVPGRRRPPPLPPRTVAEKGERDR